MDSLEHFINKMVQLLLFPIPKLRENRSAHNFLSQFIKFGIVGVSNSIVSYTVYSVSLLILKRFDLFPKYNYLLAQIAQYILSVFWSFLWNNSFVFRKLEDENRQVLKTLLKTYATYSFSGLFLSSILLVAWIDILHLSEFVAPIINIIICLPINFLINKYWTFRQEIQN